MQSWSVVRLIAFTLALGAYVAPRANAQKNAGGKKTSLAAAER